MRAEQADWESASHANARAIALYEAVIQQNGPSKPLVHIIADTESALVLCQLKLGQFEDAWNTMQNCQARVLGSANEDPRDTSRIRPLLYHTNAFAKVVIQHWPHTDPKRCQHLRDVHVWLNVAIATYESVPRPEAVAWLPQLVDELRLRTPELEESLAECENR